MIPFTSPVLAGFPGIRHGFFGRRGGVSRGPFATANVGLRSGDRPEAVRENRRRAAAALGVEATRLVTARQVHGRFCAAVTCPWGPEEAPEADALFCERPGIAIGVTTADCAPVLLADPAARRVAAVHAGWRGLLAGVLEAALHEFFVRGSRPSDIHAVIGPCIGPRSYEVGAEFERTFLATDPATAPFFRPGRSDDRRFFDLPGCVRARLVRAGLPEGNIDHLAFDTCREDRLFFSYRRSCLRGETQFGVQLSSILLVAE
ncbi:Laccase domain protein YfiH [bacterium HR40]|nr:Laccase domain protein YfiH [bacterium HR40]